MILSADAAERWRGRRVLITGASGFLGGHVARQGLAAGVEVHALGRSPGPAGVVEHAVDLRDRAGVAAALGHARPAAVIHCAAPGVAYAIMALTDMVDVAAGGTANLYEACAALPEPPVIVHVGSGFEYARSDTPVTEDHPLIPSGSAYGAAKAAASAVAGGYADRLPIALVRPFHLYGAGEGARRLGPHLVARALTGAPVQVTAGEQLRDFLHVDDAARALWLAASHLAQPGLTVLNLGSGEPIALRRYIEHVAAELARRGHPLAVEYGATPYRPDEPMVSLPDVTRIRGALGFLPRIALVQGVADLVSECLAACR